MKNTFYNIDKQKREKIMDVCFKEFGENSYDNASLNKIIKEAGISKGGMFKYIDSKKALYLYLIERIILELTEFQINHMDVTVVCYIERIEDLSKIGFDFFKGREEQFKLIMGSIFDTKSSVYSEVRDYKKRIIANYKEEILRGIDWDIYLYDKKTVMKIVEFTLSGVNQYILEMIKKKGSLGDMKEPICNNFKIGSEVLKRGLRR